MGLLPCGFESRLGYLILMLQGGEGEPNMTQCERVQADLCEGGKAYAIYGEVELQNGITLKWLRFIDVTVEVNSVEAAKAEAVRVVTMQHHPSSVKRCCALRLLRN